MHSSCRQVRSFVTLFPLAPLADVVYIRFERPDDFEFVSGQWVGVGMLSNEVTGGMDEEDDDEVDDDLAITNDSLLKALSKCAVAFLRFLHKRMLQAACILTGIITTGQFVGAVHQGGWPVDMASVQRRQTQHRKAGTAAHG